MIYILVGNDTKNKNSYINKVTKGHELFEVSEKDLSKDLILSSAENMSLFGDVPTLIITNILNNNLVTFSNEELEKLKNSETIFIFKEDKLLVAEEKKYKKYAEIEKFEEKKVTQDKKFNVFTLTDAFASRNKFLAWTLYQEALNSNNEPEAIAGVLFWKVKTMILSNAKNFTREELIKQSSDIVSIYHKAHRGEIDFTIGLEQFILSSLSQVVKS